jgi:hypothetical protein
MRVWTADWRPPLLVLPLDPRNFLNDARAGQIYRDHRCDHDAGGARDVERIRAEMAGTPAGRHPRRTGALFVLFSYRHLHRPQHSPEFALVDLLNLSALMKLRSVNSDR